MRAILFDLDGTLLDIEMRSFLGRYFGALGEVFREHFDERDLTPQLMRATEAMYGEHPERTNQQVFRDAFLEATGVDIDEHADVFNDFYRDRFPLLGDGYGPAKGAHEAIAAARSLDLAIVVATQPIFPRAAIEHRLAWAGLRDAGLTTITSYEVMHACKPSLSYFREAAAMVGCDVHDCIMVGDDRSADMPAADVGMRTFYVGRSPGTQAHWSGDLERFAELLPRLLDL